MDDIQQNNLSLRVSISDDNLKRIKIIKTLQSDEVSLMNDKEALSHFVNKAIEHFFKSDEIQYKLKNL